VSLINIPSSERNFFRCFNATDRMDNLTVTLPATTTPTEVIITFLYFSRKNSLYTEYMQYFYESEYPDEFNNPNYSNGTTVKKIFEPRHPEDSDNFDLYSKPTRFHDNYFTHALGCSDMGMDHTVFGKHYIQFTTKDVETQFILSTLLGVDSSHGKYSIVNDDTHRHPSKPWFHPLFCKFSFVVTCSDPVIKELVEGALPDFLLYKNRNNQALINSILPTNIEDFENTYYSYVNDEIYSNPFNMAISTKLLYWLQGTNNFQNLALEVSPSQEGLYYPSTTGKVQHNIYSDSTIYWANHTISTQETTFTIDRIADTVGIAILPAAKKAPVLENSNIPALAEGPILEGLFEGKSATDLQTMIYIIGKPPSSIYSWGGYYASTGGFVTAPRISPDDAPPPDLPWWRFNFPNNRLVGPFHEGPISHTPIEVSVPVVLFRYKTRDLLSTEEILVEREYLVPLIEITETLGPINEMGHTKTFLLSNPLGPANNVFADGTPGWSTILLDNGSYGDFFTYGSRIGGGGAAYQYYFFGDVYMIEDWYVQRSCTVTVELSNEVTNNKFQSVINYLKPFLKFDEKRSAYLQWFYTKITGFEDMGWELMVQEIHACVGAADFSYYGTNPSNPYKTSIAWNVDKIVRSFGINYDPSGAVQTVVLNPPNP
jgi:hypothetical protein